MLICLKTYLFISNEIFQTYVGQPCTLCSQPVTSLLADEVLGGSPGPFQGHTQVSNTGSSLLQNHSQTED